MSPADAAPRVSSPSTARARTTPAGPRPCRPAATQETGRQARRTAPHPERGERMSLCEEDECA